MGVTAPVVVSTAMTRLPSLANNVDPGPMPSVLKGRAVVTANVVTTPAVVTLRIPTASVRNSIPWPLPVSAAVNPKQAPAPVPSCGVVQPALPARVVTAPVVKSTRRTKLLPSPI